MSVDHRCPKTGCPHRVNNRLYACARHWAQLSTETKDAIHRTARPGVAMLTRWEAMARARDEWERLP